VKSLEDNNHSLVRLREAAQALQEEIARFKIA